MNVKVLEIRDRATCIPIVAYSSAEVESSREAALFRRASSPPESKVIYVQRLNDGRGNHDAYEWNDRTMATTHKYLESHWEEVKNGDIIDIPFILNETIDKMLTDVHPNSLDLLKYYD
jgi:hypothetical protein